MERAYSRWVPRIGLRPAPMDADYAALVEEGDVFVLGGAGAWSAVLVLRPTEGDALMVENVAVEPDRQGDGLGPGPARVRRAPGARSAGCASCASTRTSS